MTRTRRRRRLRTLAIIVATVIIATACEPVYTFGAVDHHNTDPDTRPWWCDSTGGGHGDHVMDPDPYEGIVKGELSQGDCLVNSIWFDMAVDYAQQWPTVGDALADDWFQVVGFASGMGTHHRRGDAANFDDVFKGWEPEFLMYDGSGPAAELTGMAWWVQSEGGPPEGFRGDNDWWHQHRDVCLVNGRWAGQDRTQSSCEAEGGVFHPNDDWWMAHAWILPDWQLQFDVFQNHHPCLEGGVHTDPEHECWMEAMHGSGHAGH